MFETEKLDRLIRKNGFTDYRWIGAKDIAVRQWARFKCMYGCQNYGKSGACPPGGVPGVEEIKKFFSEYDHAALFHFTTVHQKPEDNRSWTRQMNRRLWELEREVFLAGYYKAFVLYMGSCHVCRECAGDRLSCHRPQLSRPSPEAFAVDAFDTARKAGFPIEVLQNYRQRLNKYGILLVE